MCSSPRQPWLPPTTSTRSRSWASGRRARTSSGPWAATRGSSGGALETHRVADERAGHAVSAATAAAQLRADDGYHLDAGLAEQRVGVSVAVVRHHHARRERHEVVAAVPLLPLR